MACVIRNGDGKFWTGGRWSDEYLDARVYMDEAHAQWLVRWLRPNEGVYVEMVGGDDE